MLTNVKVAQIIKEMGHGALPSGCHFIALTLRRSGLIKALDEVLVVAPDSPMPKVYYLREDAGELTHFKAM